MSADKTQVGGSHYVNMDIQPWDAMRAWMSPEAFRGFLLGNVIKYAARHQAKGGLEDLRKASHYLDKLMETVEAGRAEGAKVLSEALDTMDKVLNPGDGNVRSATIAEARAHEESMRGQLDDIRQRQAADWPGPDWSQAPKGAVAWSVDRDLSADWWIGVGYPEVVGVTWLGNKDLRPLRASAFNYPGHWRDSLRRHPA